MGKAKHAYAVGDRVRVTGADLPYPVGHEFTIVSVHYATANAGYGPFFYKGGGPAYSEYTTELVKDPGVWENFLEPVPEPVDMGPE